MKYNNEFKNIDSAEKAYVLGQIYGDGYNHYGTHSKFSMASIDSDTPLYEVIAQLFPFLKLKKYKAHPNMIYLECHEGAFCKDLQDLGMVSPKSKNDETLKFHFPQLKKEYISHFIRGYFDADGTAYFPSRHRSRNNLKVEFGCSTKNFLLSIKKILDENKIYFSYNERFRKVNNKLYNSYNLISSNRQTSLLFADFIYKNANLYLQYKKDICYRKIDLPESNVSIFGECPYCKSFKITKIGTRQGKQRLKCSECNKRFTKPLPK